MRVLLFIFLLSSFKGYAQLEPLMNYLYEKEFNEERCLRHGREFLITNVLDAENDALQFYIDPLVAKSNGEVSTIGYTCPSENKSGLLLGFYGTFWNNSGTVFTGFGFRNLDTREASEFLNELKSIIDINKKFLGKDIINNNVTYTYKDMKVCVYYESLTDVTIRIYWEGFNCAWRYYNLKETFKKYDKMLINKQ